jgi:ribosomal-protein-alanine N-acetyltransferase
VEAGVVIETPRLTLRHLTLADVDAMFVILGDPVAMQYYPRSFTREDAVEWIERNIGRYENLGFGLWAIVLKSSGEMIGDCGLSHQIVEGVPMLEVGYHLQRSYWGHGYATEAANACMSYAFSKLEADEVISLIRPENTPSRRVAERNGMRIDRQVIYAELPHLVYSMKRESYGKT